ncbi:MAG TPA: glycosyltransferase family 39 protein [Gammaproteobacteria bacterium]|nr:glycosyltransferase family 39 protein [Gammaproteobacteria bacterium]
MERAGLKTVPRRDGLALALLAAALVLFKAWLTRAAGVDMHWDEAQYWEWSRHLDWSYYSKGPWVAWLIALSEVLFGHGEWQTRLPAWLAHGALLALVYAFAFEVWRQRAAAWWAVALVLLTPTYFTLSLVMTTDIWLFLFWTWGLWAAYRALIHGRSRAWLEAGAAVGLGTLTKLSIGLLPAAVGLAVLLVPRWRHQLRSPHLWGGLGLMVLLMSPVILWNAAHDWVMLRHEAGHVGHQSWSLERGLVFLLEQAGALSPLIVAVGLTVWWRPPAEPGPRLLWGLSLGWLAFFFIKALGAKVQLNWPAPVYLGLLILLAGHLPQSSALKRRLVYGGFVLSLVLMTVAYFPYSFGLSARQDPFKEVRAWRAPIEALARQAPAVDFIVVPNYKLAGEVAFYWPRPLPVYVLSTAGRRFNQHDLWPGLEQETGRTGLWISTGAALPAAFTRAFARCRTTAAVAAGTPGGVLRTLHSARCSDYRPVSWPQPGSY